MRFLLRGLDGLTRVLIFTGIGLLIWILLTVLMVEDRHSYRIRAQDLTFGVRP